MMAPRTASTMMNAAELHRTMRAMSQAGRPRPLPPACTPQSSLTNAPTAGVMCAGAIQSALPGNNNSTQGTQYTTQTALHTDQADEALVHARPCGPYLLAAVCTSPAVSALALPQGAHAMPTAQVEVAAGVYGVVPVADAGPATLRGRHWQHLVGSPPPAVVESSGCVCTCSHCWQAAAPSIHEVASSSKTDTSLVQPKSGRASLLSALSQATVASLASCFAAQSMHALALAVAKSEALPPQRAEGSHLPLAKPSRR